MAGKLVLCAATSLVAILSTQSMAEPISPETARRGVQLADVAPPQPRPRRVVREQPPPPPPATAVQPAPPPPPPPPAFWIGGEYIHFWRSTNDDRLLVINDANGIVPAASSADARFEGRSGFHAFGGYSWDGGRSAIEGGFMMTSRFESGAGDAVDKDEDLQPAFLPTATFGGFENAYGMTIRRASSFHTAEVNYRRLLGEFFGGRTDLIVGFRYAYFSDRLEVHVLDEPTGDTGFYQGRMRNRMFGAQVGLAFQRPLPEIMPRLGIKFHVKIAFLANNARGNQFITETQDNITLQTTVSKTFYSTMIDTGLRLTYEIWNNVMVHAGYQLIWIGGVATGPNNAANFASINAGASALLHGPVAGLKVRF